MFSRPLMMISSDCAWYLYSFLCYTALDRKHVKHFCVFPMTELQTLDNNCYTIDFLEVIYYLSYHIGNY